MGNPKPAFYVVLLLVIAALVGFAFYRFGKPGGKGPGGQASQSSQAQQGGQAGPGGAELPADRKGEDADTAGITTKKEYDFVPAQRLPEVKGVSAYAPMKDRTVRLAINVWAGWAPIIYANEGFTPGKVWKDANGKPFKVELVLIDDPVAMRDAFAAGNVHLGWSTVDMLPLLVEGLQKDSRVMPRVFQQIDWSNGGDGIVVRDNVKTMSELRGKTVVLAQNSPSHFFALNALVSAGVQPAEVQFKFVGDAFQAAAAFNADKSIAGCVSWSPDIYNLEKVKGNKLIVSTGTANKLIADVWFARADFAKDHGDIVEGLVRGIFDAMVDLKAQEARAKAAGWMAKGYGIPETDALSMLGDAHSTNFAENAEFFLNQNNPTNFERTYDNAYFLYKRVGAVGAKVPFDQLADFSILKKLASVSKYSSQVNEYETRFAPASAGAIQAESNEILTKTVVVHFFPNSWDLRKKVVHEVNGKDKEELYDPNVDFVLEEIGRLAGQFGAARVVIEGHSDSSMQGRVPASLVQELSLNRANAVKEGIIKMFPKLDPNQFSAAGLGWDRPADPNDPQNHAKNRRVEVKVYPAEAVAPAK
jgi:ABC-type nitrate/sulfonate/bicarbonate transport system substrate-binding protein/outer membrane protein OmpA-like peptidoglycan-associated protein